MPVVSKRQHYLRRLKHRYARRKRAARLRFYLDFEDGMMDEFDDLLFSRYKTKSRQRYLFRSPTYQSRQAHRDEKVNRILHTDFYSDPQFKAHFCVSCEMFWAMLPQV